MDFVCVARWLWADAVGEALGLDIRSIHEDFRTLEIVRKAKRGELQDHMKTKNADSRHGRVVDLSEPLAAMLRDFVGGRTDGLVFVNRTEANSCNGIF